MSITLPCPKCGAILSFSEKYVGARVRCTKFGCGALVSVPDLIPAEEVQIIDAAPIALTPKKASTETEAYKAIPQVKPRPIDIDDGSDDEPAKPAARMKSADGDDDSGADRPSRARREREEPEKQPSKNGSRQQNDGFGRGPRRKRKKTESGVSAGLIAAIILGGILLVVVLGFGTYLLVDMGSSVAKESKESKGNTESTETTISKVKPPDGWKEFTYSPEGFKAYFPNEPLIERGGSADIGRFHFPGIDDATAKRTVESMSSFSTGTNVDPLKIVILICRYKPGGAARERVESDIRQNCRQSAAKRNTVMKPIRWLGQQAEEVSAADMVMRVAFTEMRAYVVLMRGKIPNRAPPAVEQGFFDNMELLK